MRAEYRKRKNGPGYYSLLYTDPHSQRRLRVPQKKILALYGKPLTTLAEAKRMIQHLAPEYVPLQKRLEQSARASQQSAHRQKLLDFYHKRQAKVAPNSYRNNVHYLTHYVFTYFFERAHVGDVGRWHHHFEKYQEWLESEARSIRDPRRKLSYSTRNRCISTLNTFLQHLYRNRQLEVLHLCPSFPKHLCKTRSLEAVIPEEAQQQVIAQLDQMGHRLEATFFQLLCQTGMRFNEALGISLEDVYTGQLQHSVLSQKLQQYEIPHHGYLLLKSQPAGQGRRLRDASGRILRKPLKGNKEIHEKHARLIPITDLSLWQRLGQLYNEQVTRQQQRVHGYAGDQYALFEGIDKSSSSVRLCRALKALGLPRWSWHCCRHSCATQILGRTGDLMLARMWLGHRSADVIERYVHVHEELVRRAGRHGDSPQDYQMIPT